MSYKPVTESLLKHKSIKDQVPEIALHLMKLTSIEFYYSHVQNKFMLFHVRSDSIGYYTVELNADEPTWLKVIQKILKDMEEYNAVRISDSA